MITIESLNRIIELDRNIKQLSLTIDQGQRTGNTYELLKQKQGTLLAEQQTLQEEALQIIMQMELPQQQTVMMLRYINCDSWKNIRQVFMYSDKSTVYKIHKRALTSFFTIQNEK